MTTDENDFRARGNLPYFPGSYDTIHPFHDNVEHDHVGRGVAEQLKRLAFPFAASESCQSGSCTDKKERSASRTNC
jgi:hypothetical protein